MLSGAKKRPAQLTLATIAKQHLRPNSGRPRLGLNELRQPRPAEAQPLLTLSLWKYTNGFDLTSADAPVVQAASYEDGVNLRFMELQ